MLIQNFADDNLSQEVFTVNMMGVAQARVLMKGGNGLAIQGQQTVKLKLGMPTLKSLDNGKALARGVDFDPLVEAEYESAIQFQEKRYLE